MDPTPDLILKDDSTCEVYVFTKVLADRAPKVCIGIRTSDSYGVAELSDSDERQLRDALTNHLGDGPCEFCGHANPHDLIAWRMFDTERTGPQPTCTFGDCVCRRDGMRKRSATDRKLSNPTVIIGCDDCAEEARHGRLVVIGGVHRCSHGKTISGSSVR
jgi:hypothetical protein